MSDEPIWKKLVALGENVPPEEWDRLEREADAWLEAAAEEIVREHGSGVDRRQLLADVLAILRKHRDGKA